MFKVVCINDKYLPPQHPKIEVGGYYTVEGIEKFLGDDYYILEEVKQLAADGLKYNYSDERFAQISEIDETEMIREQLTETA